MTKKFLALALLVVLSVACGGTNPVAPTVPLSSDTPDANGVVMVHTVPPVPSWVFGVDGKIHHPAENKTYKVWLSPEVVSDPELKARVDQALQATTDLTRGRITFVYTPLEVGNDIAYRINQRCEGNKVGCTRLRMLSDVIVGADISIYDRTYAMTNTTLHEFGHFLFGDAHSPVPGDVMTDTSALRGDMDRMSFSPNEYAVYDALRQVPSGTRR